MLGCTIVDSFLRGLLDGSTACIGVPDYMPAWYICLESLGMPWPRLPRLGTYVFRVRLCSAFCTEQQLTYLLTFYLIFIFCRVASGACQVNRTDDRFASSSTRDSLRYPVTY